jgi:general secretion pathway protein I
LPQARVSPADSPIAGFTIIEALVALAVIAVSIVAIGSVMGTTARGVRKLEQHVALVQAAYNALWLSFPSRAPPASSTQSGLTMEQRWRADIENFPIDFGPASGEVLWVPQKITVQVQSHSGATIAVETVRLFRRRTE